MSVLFCAFIQINYGFKLPLSVILLMNIFLISHIRMIWIEVWYWYSSHMVNWFLCHCTGLWVPTSGECLSIHFKGFWFNKEYNLWKALLPFWLYRHSHGNYLSVQTPLKRKKWIVLASSSKERIDIAEFHWDKTLQNKANYFK